MILETLAAQRARRRPWVETVYLLRLTLLRDAFAAGGPTASLTLRLSDRLYRYPEPRTTAPFEQWLPLVLNWGQIGDALNPQDGGLEVAAFDMTLDNTRRIGGVARFSDLIRAGRATDGYDLPFSPAELLQVFRGLDTNDRVRLFRLVVEELGSITDQAVELRLSGIELVLEDRDRLPRITTDVFPFAAPSAVGEPVPLLMGNLRRVPLLFVRAGLIDKLRLPVNPDAPGDGGALVLSTPDIVARLPPSGVVQLKIRATTASGAGSTPSGLISSNDLAAFLTTLAECISYNGTDPATARLLDIRRGARNTMPGEADPGTDVYQVLDEYIGIAGVNLGPLAASAFTAVYCDGMFKEPHVPPVHSVAVANTTVWPGQSVSLVRFQSTVPAGVFATCVEIKEIATMDDGRCYTAHHVSGVGNEFRTPAGVPVVRVGLDAPCGMPTQVYDVWMRFSIADLPDDPGQNVVLRFFRGVHTGGAGSTSSGGAPEGYGLGEIELVYRPGWVGPIAGGHGTASGIDHRLAPVPVNIGTVLQSGAFLDQYVYVDVSDAYAASKASGSGQFALGLIFEWDQIDAFNIFTANWYGIGAAGNALPALMLGTAANAGTGALLTRPNAGTASGSAAEASLGLVTVDISGPAPAPPELGVFVDPGLTASHGLGWRDSGDSRPGHGPDVPLLPPITCASGAEQGDNYCQGPPSFESNYSHLNTAGVNALDLNINLLVDYLAQDFKIKIDEYVYAGIYRGLDNIPALYDRIGFDLHPDSGTFIGPWGETPTRLTATFELVAFNDPLSVEDLQAHTHDTIAGAVREVLGTYTTEDPGPHNGVIGAARFFGWRIRADSFPPVPSHHPDGFGQSNYTTILLQHIQFFSGTPD